MESHDQDLVNADASEGAMSDINVTPFIDVMLVLLIIFMVTAPLMMGGVHINLPKTDGTPMERPEKPLIVSLDAENQIYVDKDMVPDATRASIFRELAIASQSGEVFVRGDGEVKYGKMMELMSELGQAGFARVTLVTNVQKGGPTVTSASADTGATGADAPTAPTVSPAPSPNEPAPTASSQGTPTAAATLPGV
jgi:TolR protein